MKKYYVNLPIVFGWGFILIIGIMGFIWETLDLRTFNVFSLIMSVIIPIVMCVFGYFLCEIGTKVTFHAVVKAIQKEYP